VEENKSTNMDKLKSKVDEICKFLKETGNSYTISDEIVLDNNSIIVIETKYVCMSLFNLPEPTNDNTIALNIFFRHDVKASYSAKFFMKFVNAGLTKNTVVLEIEDFYISAGKRFIGKDIDKQMKRERKEKFEKIQNKYMDEVLESLKPKDMVSC